MSNLDPFIHSHLKMNVPSFLIKTYEILEVFSIYFLFRMNPYQISYHGTKKGQLL